MKSEFLLDAIGEIRDEFILEAHRDIPMKRRPHFVRKTVSVAACITLLTVASVPALAAVDNQTAYQMLYSVSPQFAQKLIPVHKSCDSSGIRMEVLSAKIHGDQAEILLSIQDTTGARLDETTDLFDSYSINTPFSASATCSLVEFNKTTGTGTFLIRLTQWNNEPIPGDKITFSVSKILSKKHHENLSLPEIDLTSVSDNPTLMKSPKIRGWSGTGNQSEPSKHLLLPHKQVLGSPLHGVSITGAGIIDGKLHIQAAYDDILKTDNHGDIYLMDSEGKRISCESSTSFWDDTHQNSYSEYVFGLPLEKLPQYKVWGEFWTCDTLIPGNWQVTIPLAQK